MYNKQILLTKKQNIMQKFLRTLALMACMLVPWVTQAQNELTVYEDGTATNGNVPVHGYYADAYLKAHFVYPADELSEMGTSATISQMTFYASQSSVTELSGETYNVYLAEVDDATINAFADVSSMELVYSGGLTISSGQWVIEFDADYTYSGGNLLVAVEQSTKCSSYPTTTWYGVSSTNSSVQGYSYSGLSDISPSQKNFLPKVTFVYTSAGSGPICAKPGAITLNSVTTTTAIISWTAGGSETQWKVYLDDNYVATVNNPEYRYESLTASTTYSVAVSAVCGSDESVQRTASITTGIADNQLTLYADGTATNAYVPFYNYYGDTPHTGQFIIPAADVAALAGQELLGFSFYPSSSSVTSATFDVTLSTTAESSYASATPIDIASGTTVYQGTLSVADGKMTIVFTTPFIYTGGNIVVDFTITATGNYSQMNFNGTSDYSAASVNTQQNAVYNFLPKVTFYYNYQEVACAIPTGLTVENITATEADFSWTPGAAEEAWKVYLNDELVATVNTPSYHFTSLSSLTNCVVGVVADCGSNGTSLMNTTAFNTPGAGSTCEVIVACTSTSSYSYSPSTSRRRRYPVRSSY